MTTLGEILNTGHKALEDARKADADKEAEQERYEREFESARLQAALEILPEALRQFATIVNETLIITLPSGAKVEHLLNIITDNSGDWTRPIFRAVELATNRRSGNQWRAYKWALADGEAAYWPAAYCPSLEIALALAEELYEGREEVENDAARMQAKITAREKKEPSVADYYCPLIRDDCRGAACAWWTPVAKHCGVAVIADTQLHVLE